MPFGRPSRHSAALHAGYRISHLGENRRVRSLPLENRTPPNVTYAVHDGVELTGDLYLPAGRGPFPSIVNVHGGYWRRGSRDTFQYWGPYLAERGYAGFTISYRLTKPGTKRFPDAANDVRAAVQFLRGSAAANCASIPPASRCGAIPRARTLPRSWRWPATARCSPAPIRRTPTPHSRPASSS